MSCGRFRLQASLLLALAWLLNSSAAFSAQEIKSLSTRPGVTVKILLDIPKVPAKAVLLMFPGGNGSGMFKETDGRVHLGKNFLVRTSPQFVRQGMAVAIVDAPSDQPNGMSAGFRNSPDHVQDIRKIIDFLYAQGLKPIYLVGTSMGTLSVAYLGMELQDSRIKGLILTSTVTQYVNGLRLPQIAFPVLLVHHLDDGCKLCPFREAVALKTKLSGSPKVDFIEVQGGDPPQSGPCQALSQHGFLGVEDQVVKAMVDWTSGQSVPARVGR